MCDLLFNSLSIRSCWNHVSGSICQAITLETYIFIRVRLLTGNRKKSAEVELSRIYRLFIGNLCD